MPVMCMLISYSIQDNNAHVQLFNTVTFLKYVYFFNMILGLIGFPKSIQHILKWFRTGIRSDGPPMLKFMMERAVFAP